MNSSSIISLAKGINLTKILSGANKTLNFVKGAVPIYKEIKPIYKNVRNFIGTYNEIKKPKLSTVKTKDRPLIKKSSTQKFLINDNLTFFQ